MRRRVIAVTDLDEPIAALAARTDQRILATWAADCAERVLPYFEGAYPDDARPRRALEACRAWVRTGLFRMVDIRAASLGAHAAARAAEGSAARSAARAAGQAVATAHVPAHAITAGRYAATAPRDAAEEGPDEAALAERQWQYRHLQELAGRGSGDPGDDSAI